MCHMQQTKGTIKPGDQEGYITVITPDESCDVLVKHSLPVRQSVLVNDVCKLRRLLRFRNVLEDSTILLHIITVSCTSTFSPITFHYRTAPGKGLILDSLHTFFVF